MSRPSLSSAVQDLKEVETILGDPVQVTQAELKEARRRLVDAEAALAAVETITPEAKPVGERIDALCQRINRILVELDRLDAAKADEASDA